MENRKVVGYMRVGNAEQLTQKQDDFKDLLIKNDYTVSDIYEDYGYSGLDKNRPSYQKLIQDVREGKMKNIIVKDYSRISRRTEDVLEFEDICKENGVEVIYLNNPNTLTEYIKKDNSILLKLIMNDK